MARAAGVGAGEQQQVGDQTAHAARGPERRGDHLALLGPRLAALEPLLEQLEVGEDAGQRGAQLVRGVGDELALGLHHLLGLGAGRVELAKHLVERAGELGDLVVGLGLGIRREGSRVVAISRAAAVSAAIGRIARPATASPASAASTVPPRTPAASRNQSRPIVASSDSRVLRRTGRRWRGGSASVPVSTCGQATSKLADPDQLGLGGPERRGGRELLEIGLPVEVDDADDFARRP